MAWGRRKESWSVDYHVHDGQTAEGAVWQKLTGVLNAYYPSESGATLPIVKFAIDSGYATPEVYAWTRKYGGPRAAAPVSQPSPIDVGPQGQRVKFGIRVWPVNGAMIKEELYRWLRLDRPAEESGESYPPGYCHFPKYNEEYFKQLTAEQLVTRVVKGYRRPEWQKTRDGNQPSTVEPTREPRRPFTGWIGSQMSSGRRWRGGWQRCPGTVRRRHHRLNSPDRSARSVLIGCSDGRGRSG